MRVIARSTLQDFVASLEGSTAHKAVKTALDNWFHQTRAATWLNPAEVRSAYATASIVSADRVVFNIKGNDFRLITAIDYRRQIVYIKWIGSHSDYDHIDARTVEYAG